MLKDGGMMVSRISKIVTATFMQPTNLQKNWFTLNNCVEVIISKIIAFQFLFEKKLSCGDVDCVSTLHEGES